MQKMKWLLAACCAALGSLSAFAQEIEVGYNAPSAGAVMPAGSQSTYSAPKANFDVPKGWNRVFSPENPKVSPTQFNGTPSENPRDPGEETFKNLAEGQITRITHSFNTIGNTGTQGGDTWIPPDTMLAAGPSDILVSINDDFAIYDRDGTQLGQWDINTFTGITDTIFDPKLMYDQWDGRFLMVWVIRRQGTTLANSLTEWLVMISDDSTAVGNWSWYRLDAGVNGATPNSEWADYPYVGVDPDAVCITARMFGWFGSGADYGKIRFLRKSQIYAGLGANWWDFWGSSTSGTPNRNIAAAQMHSWPGEFYCMASGNSGDSHLALFRFTNTTFTGGGPVQTIQSVNVGAYNAAPDAAQPNGFAALDNVTPRLMGLSYYLSEIFTSHSREVNSSGSRAAAHYFKISNAATPVVLWNRTIFNSAYHFWFPQVDVNNQGDMGLVMASTEPANTTSGWGGVEVIGRQSADADHSGFLTLKSGEGSYVRNDNIGRNRWGDYFAAAKDPWDNRSIYVLGEYARTSNNYGNWAGRFNWKPIPTIVSSSFSAQTTSTINLSATVTDGGSPISGISVEFLVSGTSVGSATTNASGIANLTYTIPLQVPTSRTITARTVETTVYNSSSDTSTMTITKADTACFDFDVTWPYSATNAYLWAYLWRTTDNTALTGQIMTLRVGGTSVGTIAMGSTWVQLPISALYTPGVYNYTVEYAGNSFYNSSISDGANLTIEKADTVLDIVNISGSGGDNIPLVAQLNRTTDNAALSGRVVNYLIEGVGVGSAVTNASGTATLNWVATSGVLGARAYAANWAGSTFYNAASDTAVFTRVNKVISGQIGLQNWIPAITGQVAQFQLINTGGVVVDTWSQALPASGSWSRTYSFLASGNYRVRAKVSHWLSDSRVVAINGAGASGINLSLKNGDVVNDNEVGPSDFAVLAASFGTEVGDPGYVANADLDGNSEVGPSDFAILSNNFGEEGT